MKYESLGSSARIAMQVPALKPSAYSRVTGKPEVITSPIGLVWASVGAV
jgi:hypothetical protein